MRGKYLHQKIATGRLTLPVVVLITIVCWLISFFYIPDLPTRNFSYSFLEVLRVAPPTEWISRIISFLIYISIGYLLIFLNNTFAIIRIRASIQTAVYWLFVAACPIIHQLDAGNAASVGLFLCIYFLFNSYQSSRPSASICYAFLFLAIGSLAFPKLTYIAPLLWLTAYKFKALTPRSFTASLVGWGLPYWFFFCYCYLSNQTETFYSPFIELTTFHPVDLKLLYPREVAAIAYCLILFAVSSTHIFTYGYQDKIRTRSYLYFLIQLNFCLFLFIFLQPVYGVELLSLLLIGISILFGHMIALTKSKAAHLFFIGSIIGWLALSAFNIWILL